MADDDRITRAEPRNHNDEQKKIEGQLAELVPESLLDITCLLEFAIDRVGQYGCMAHGAEIDMLRRISGPTLGTIAAPQLMRLAPRPPKKPKPKYARDLIR